MDKKKHSILGGILFFDAIRAWRIWYRNCHSRRVCQAFWLFAIASVIFFLYLFVICAFICDKRATAIMMHFFAFDKFVFKYIFVIEHMRVTSRGIPRKFYILWMNITNWGAMLIREWFWLTNHSALWTTCFFGCLS